MPDDTKELRAALEGLRSDRTARAVLAREAGLLTERVIVRGRLALGQVVPLEQLLYVEQGDDHIRYHLADGRIVPSNTTYTLETARLQLEPFIRVRFANLNQLVNLDQLVAVGPAPAGQEGRLLYLGPSRVAVPLADGRVPAIKKALGLESLDHVIPWSERYETILREGIRDFEEPIKRFSVERLRAEFRYQTIPDVDLRQVMANMLWQYHSWLTLPAGDPRKTWPIDGNIRSFWYYIKPVMSRLGALDAEKRYDQLIELLSSLVWKKVFRYREFGFIDEGEAFRTLPAPPGFPHIVMVAEKTGVYPKLKRLQSEFNFSIIALGGTPSLLTSEYFVDQLAAVVDLKTTPLRLISFVDYDPAGDTAIACFCNQLRLYGMKSYTLAHVLTPARFPPDELASVVYELPNSTQGDRTRAAKWIAAGGGVDGKPLGIKSDAFALDFERFRGVVAELVAEAQEPPAKLLSVDSDPLAEWGLPPYFSAELLETDEPGFWEEWSRNRPPTAIAPT